LRNCAVDVIARRHLAEVETKLKDLKALQRELESIVTQCECGTISQCRIIEAL